MYIDKCILQENTKAKETKAFYDCIHGRNAKSADDTITELYDCIKWRKAESNEETVLDTIIYKQPITDPTCTASTTESAEECTLINDDIMIDSSEEGTLVYGDIMIDSSEDETLTSQAEPVNEFRWTIANFIEERQNTLSSGHMDSPEFTTSEGL